MKRILVAIDSSAVSGDVLRATVDLASAVRAHVSLLHVVEGAGDAYESGEALLSAARAQLDELTAGAPASGVEILQPARGIAWQGICESARTCDADLVSIGAHGYGPFERVLGTTAAKVVNHCGRSVLVVRRWRGPPRRMLVALDDSERKEVVRDYAVLLARRTNGRLRLFRSVDMPSVVPADMLQQYPTIEEALRQAAARALGEEARLVPPELLDGVGAEHGAKAWPTICAAARDYDADLVVMGSHGFGLVDRLLGTTAARVVNHADRSVLVVKRPW
ncbi:MAG TPA: universal stress protein [Polyangiaceae bacterium]|jgi:nucleotide-binding universal stress UspA family protein